MYSYDVIGEARFVNCVRFPIPTFLGIELLNSSLLPVDLFMTLKLEKQTSADSSYPLSLLMS
jgi:hypothetical protein